MKFSRAFAQCLSIFLAVTLQASSTIGVAVANGRFLLDRSSVVGNASVFDGSILETGKVMSDLSLTSGLKIRLGVESRGRVFSDRLVLEKGAGQISGPNSVAIAGRLHVIPVEANAIARVVYGPSKRVEVAALGGRVRVETAEGVALAKMDSGASLSFEEQGGASGPTRLTGKVARINGKLTLTDAITKVTVELRGAGLEQYIGQTVTVTGDMVGPDVLQVGSVAKAAGGAAAAGGTGAASGVGLSTTAIAGIAIGGATALGLGLGAAAGAFGSGNASK
jgi:hypothetical protein